MKLFRSMKEDSDGLPTIGSSGRSLGVRLGDTSTPDVLAVEPNDVILPTREGCPSLPAIHSTCCVIVDHKALAAADSIRYGHLRVNFEEIKELRPCAGWPLSVPQVVSQSTSPTGGWKRTDMAEC